MVTDSEGFRISSSDDINQCKAELQEIDDLLVDDLELYMESLEEPQIKYRNRYEEFFSQLSENQRDDHWRHHLVKLAERAAGIDDGKKVWTQKLSLYATFKKRKASN